MKLSEQNWASISEIICPEILVFFFQLCLLDVIFSERPDECYDFTNLIFMTLSL